MSVDTKLYIGNQVEPEVIAYTLAKAVGIEPNLEGTEPNIHSASKYLKTHDFSPASYWNIVVDEHTIRYHLHRSHDMNPFGVTWLLSGKARPSIIAAFRVVAESLGGLLIWKDSDDIGTLYQGPENQGFQSYWQAAYDTKEATITSQDEAHSEY